MALQKKIKGRDKTTPTKYSIHLSVMMDWYPILGKTGYTVYSAYVLITAIGIEIGTRKLAKHLGLGQTSFLLNTELLDMLGLIKLHRGSFTRPNIVDILDPPAVNPGTLSDIRAAVMEDEILSRESAAYFRDALLKRLDSWSSLSDYIDFELVSIPLPSTNGNGKPSTVPIVNTSDDAGLIARLEKIGFDNPGPWLAQNDAALVAAWLNELENDTDLKKRVKAPAGFLRAKVESGEYPVDLSPPVGMGKCHRCGAFIPDHAKYCDGCKTELNIQT